MKWSRILVFADAMKTLASTKRSSKEKTTVQDMSTNPHSQISCLRGLQEMYRDRILSQQAKILKFKQDLNESSTVGLTTL
jgi:hypothetical protein